MQKRDAEKRKQRVARHASALVPPLENNNEDREEFDPYAHSASTEEVEQLKEGQPILQDLLSVLTQAGLHDTLPEAETLIKTRCNDSTDKCAL